MRKIERTNALAVVAAGAMGTAAGWLVQFALVSRGVPTFVPPLSLPITLAAVATVLIVLGIRLRRAVTHRPGDVNPFHAFRLLLTARAAQFVGAIFGGFGGGLWIAIVGRSIAPAASVWSPMLFTVVGGAVLIACGVITELLCRVPPGDDEQDSGEADPSLGPADQPAYRDSVG